MKHIKRVPVEGYDMSKVYEVVDETDDCYCVEEEFDFAAKPRTRTLRLWWSKKDCIEVMEEGTHDA